MDLQNELGKRGVLPEVQMPTYGYMWRDVSYQSTKGENLISDWAIGTLKGAAYTGRKGRNAGKDSPICQLPWADTEHPFARRWRMRYTRGVRYKECQRGQLAELQMDEIALQRDILVEENRQEATEGGRRALNIRLLAEIDSGWELERTKDADTCKSPLLNYQE